MHDKRREECPTCSPANFCPHGMMLRDCVRCSGCTHGKVARKCLFCKWGIPKTVKLHCVNLDAAYAKLILNGARFCEVFKNAETRETLAVGNLEGEIILCRVNQNDTRRDAAPSAVASRVAKATGVNVATIRKRMRTKMPVGNVWFLMKIGPTPGRRQHQASKMQTRTTMWFH